MTTTEESKVGNESETIDGLISEMQGSLAQIRRAVAQLKPKPMQREDVQGGYDSLGGGPEGEPMDERVRQTALAWDEHYADESGLRHWPNEELVRFMSRFFDYDDPSPQDSDALETIVDVGAGNGANLGLLRAYADTVHAIEPRLEQLQALRLRGYIEVEPHQAIAQEIPLDDGEADLVVDCMTSQHVPWFEHLDVYREYRRVLKPSGWLWLYHLDSGTHPSADIGATYDNKPLKLFPSLPLTCTPPTRSLEAVVVDAGFHVEESRGLVRKYPRKPGWRGRGSLSDTFRGVASYTILAARAR